MWSTQVTVRPYRPRRKLPAVFCGVRAGLLQLSLLPKFQALTCELSCSSTACSSSISGECRKEPYFRLLASQQDCTTQAAHHADARVSMFCAMSRQQHAQTALCCSKMNIPPYPDAGLIASRKRA